MKQELINKIREACYKANPDILRNNTSMLLEGHFHGIINYRDKSVHLTDVLLAINKKRVEYTVRNSFAEEIHFYMNGGDGKVKAIWNLKKTFENQLEETLKFIADLL